MSYRLPKSFKPAELDLNVVEAESLTSKKQQLWHFTFPQNFNVAAFSELELQLPSEPISSATQGAQHVASFELEGHSYRIIEGSVFETNDIINLFPSSDNSGEYVLGKPFTRCFRIHREIVFPAPPKSIPLNPRGRAPNQLESIKKNFFPIGYINESLTDEWKTPTRQGRILRSTSARPESPRLLPQHGFDLKEWKPLAVAADGTKSKPTKSSSSSDSSKKDKKASKRSSEAASEERPSKKVKSEDAADEESSKKKKEKKHKKDKQ